MKAVLSVAAVLFCMSFVYGQGLALKEVGGAVGYSSISFNGGSSSESLGGFVISGHVNLGELMNQLEFIPEVQYMSTSKDVSGLTWKVSDFAINANVHYNIAMEGKIKPYVGAGLGYNALSSTVNLPSYTLFGFTYGGEVTNSASRIGINILAGANYALNEKMLLFIEPRYVLASDFNHFLLKVGASFAMQ